MTAARAVALGILLAAFTTAHAQMHKCVDERGRTHYTDKPIPGCKPGVAPSQPAPPIAATPTTKAKPATKAKPGAKVALSAEERAKFISRCKTLQEEYDWLHSPRGRAVEAHAARVGQVRQAMRGCP